MKFFGEVGYADTVEQKPGRFVKEVTEREYFGDVIKDTRRLEPGASVNKDIRTGNSISIVAADDYANENFYAMAYVRWRGVLWSIEEVDASQPPRLILRLGGVYNGPTASAPADESGSSSGNS